MRPQPVMPSRSLTSAALRTLGCVRQRDRPAPPRPLRPHANLEQARCRRAYGVDSSRLCSHEDSVVIAVDVKSEHRIVPDATAMLGRNDPSALLAPDEDGRRFLPILTRSVTSMGAPAGAISPTRSSMPGPMMVGRHPAESRRILRSAPAGRTGSHRPHTG